MKPLLYISILTIAIACGQKKDKQVSDTTTSDTSKQNHNQPDTLMSTSSTDTSFADLSKRFMVTISSYPDTTMPNIEALNVAVIPLDSIAAVKIPWNDNQKQMTKETEKEFETELLECKDGKDKNGEAGAETKMKKGYCERTGYGDAGMGHVGYPYFCSFKKDNNLVVIEVMTYWSACTTGYETKKEMKECEDEKAKAMKQLDDYIAGLVATLKVKRL